MAGSGTWGTNCPEPAIIIVVPQSLVIVHVPCPVCVRSRDSTHPIIGVESASQLASRDSPCVAAVSLSCWDAGDRVWSRVAPRTRANSVKNDEKVVYWELYMEAAVHFEARLWAITNRLWDAQKDIVKTQNLFVGLDTKFWIIKNPVPSPLLQVQSFQWSCSRLNSLVV